MSEIKTNLVSPVNPAGNVDIPTLEVSGARPTVTVTARTALAGVDTDIGSVYLNEGGRSGVFNWRSGDYSTEVAADTEQGIYVASDSVATTSGAWVRQYDGAVNILWFGALGENATADTAASRAAYAALPTAGGTLEFPDIGVPYYLQVDDSLEQHWNVLSNNQTTYTAIELTKSNTTFTGKGELKLIGTQVDLAFSYLFANSKDNALSNITFTGGLRLNLDAQAYTGSTGQWRGIMLISTDDILIDDTVTIVGGTSKAGYGVDLHDCTGVKIDATMRTISGGVFASYSSGIRLNLDIETFNEAIDFDKVVSSAVVSGRYKNSSGQIVDANACTNIVLSDLVAENAGLLVFFNGKKEMSPTWADHLLGLNEQFFSGSGLVVDDSVTCVDCNSGGNLIQIGNNWSGNPHVNVLPVSDITILGTFQGSGQVSIQEGINVQLGCKIVDCTPPSNAAVYAISEDDWATYPDAEDWSDLDITLLPSFQVDGCTLGGVAIRYASRFHICDGARIENVNTSLTASIPALTLGGDIGVRNTSGHIGGILVDGTNCTVGINSVQLTASTGRITVADNVSIIGTPSNAWALNGSSPDADVYIAPVLDAYFGDNTAGTDVERILGIARSNIKIIDFKFAAGTSIATDPTDYVQLILSARDNDGSTRVLIDQISTLSDAITAFAFTQSSNPITDADAIVPLGGGITVRTVHSGTGQEIVDGRVSIKYLPY